VLVAEFARALFAIAQPGQVMGPVATQFGTHFILLEGIYPAQQVAAEQARDIARREIGQRARAQRLSEVLQQLQQAAEIARNEEALELLRQDEEQILRERNAQMRETVRH
jgi:parvulin-like peptidyl-prolyl isomerase